MDQGITETTRKLYRKALLQCMLTVYDASKRYNNDLLGAIHLLNWKELTPSNVANCFMHASISCAIVSNPYDDKPDNDQTCSDLYEGVYRIAGQEVDGNFEMLMLANAAAPAIASAKDAEIIDTVGDPDADEEEKQVDKEPH